MLTDSQLAAWRELCDRATPAPWKVDRIGCGEYPDYDIEIDWPGGLLASINPCPGGYQGLPGCGGNPEVNAAFIAAARSALPALLDEVERLRGEVAAARAAALEEAAKVAEERGGDPTSWVVQVAAEEIAAAILGLKGEKA